VEPCPTLPDAADFQGSVRNAPAGATWLTPLP
jgi:hypothetical protein